MYKNQKTNYLPEEIFNSADVNKNICLFCNPNVGMNIFSTKNLNLLRVNYPASKGHLMISSKVHYGSMGELEMDFFSELEYLKSKIIGWYESKNIECICYEHGSAGSCNGIDPNDHQCEHFYLNFIPSSICIHDKLLKKYPNRVEVNSIEEVPSLFQKWGEYLYFENSDRQKVFYPVYNNDVAPHLLRTLICEAMSCSEKGNWQKRKNYNDFLESFNFTKSIRDIFS